MTRSPALQGPGGLGGGDDSILLENLASVYHYGQNGQGKQIRGRDQVASAACHHEAFAYMKSIREAD